MKSGRRNTVENFDLLPNLKGAEVTLTAGAMSAPLPAGINLINILQAAFSYKIVLHSFHVLTVKVCNFLVKENCWKSCL
jgi:hypothetical protein